MGGSITPIIPGFFMPIGDTQAGSEPCDDVGNHDGDT